MLAHIAMSLDLSGTTPLGWAAAKSGKRPSVSLQKSLFSPGDRSIMPRTPHSLKARSPRRAIGAMGGSGFHLSYAYSEAAGWRGQMEDRIIIKSPFPCSIQWSLFGVLDGHGGDFAVSYLSQEIPRLIERMVCDYLKASEGKEDKKQLSNDETWGRSHPPLPEKVIENILYQSILASDYNLSQQKCMKVSVVDVPIPQPRARLQQEVKDETAPITKKKFVTLDTSGSTAAICLISDTLVAVANVGDSRVVLARRSTDILSPRQPFAPISSSSPRQGWDARVASVLDAVPLSQDHKLDLPGERARAEAAGGM